MPKSPQYILYDSKEYKDLISSFPAISKIIKDFMVKVSNTLFKDKIIVNILLDDNRFYLMPGIVYSLSNVNKVNAYKQIYCELMDELPKQKHVFQLYKT